MATKKTTKATEKLKEAQDRIVELNAKIKELAEENKALKGKAQEIDLSELQYVAANVRFSIEDEGFVMDKVAYSDNGIASLVSTEPVGPRGFVHKKEVAFKKLMDYTRKVVKDRLFKDSEEGLKALAKARKEKDSE